MDWFRKLPANRKRLVIIAGGVGVGLLLVLMSRRGGGAAATAGEGEQSHATLSGGVPMMTAGVFPNAAYDSAFSDLLSDVADQVQGVRDDVARIPLPTPASEVFAPVLDYLRERTDAAGPAPVTTPPPVTASPAIPAAPTPAPKPPVAGPVGGRRVGPWATAAQRDAAVKNIPPGKVRKYREGGKFYAEIFD